LVSLRFWNSCDALQLALQRLAQAFLLLLFDGEPLLLLLQPRGVVAFPRNAVATVELEDPAGDVVEEVTIVRHRNDGAGVAFEETLQPGDRLGVEMVGGLVEQQHVRLRQQQAAQRDAAPLAAGNFRDVGVPWRQAQRVRRDFELALQLPAALGVDRVLQFRLLFEELVHLPFVEVRVGEFVADRVEAVDERLDFADALDDVAAHVLVRIELRLLRQQADLDAGLRPRLAFDLAVDAGHDAQERRFTGAVQAEHADLGAREK
jgi:hypothetical protein